IAVIKNGSFPAQTQKMIPQVLFQRDDIPDKFLWNFRCDYGLSVLGIRPPESDGKTYELIEKEPDIIDITKKNPAMVFAALYNYAWPQGMGFGQYLGITMTAGEAHNIIAHSGGHVRYCHGRPMILNIANDTNILNVGSYNRNNGRGIAQRAIRTVPNTR
ncbi:MAG: hypothetical protein FWC51_03745, partial [Proteobacteria bacterium]|nr:hypothetical protein [Pseudomonadota bacterium]